jgi:aconitate hydratase
MINGIGVPGWGVVVSKQKQLCWVSHFAAVAECCRYETTGKLNPGVTATDLALTVTNILRSHGVVGCFVEYFGDGIHNISVEDRALSRICLLNMVLLWVSSR